MGHNDSCTGVPVSGYPYAYCGNFYEYRVGVVVVSRYWARPLAGIGVGSRGIAKQQLEVLVEGSTTSSTSRSTPGSCSSFLVRCLHLYTTSWVHEYPGTSLPEGMRVPRYTGNCAIKLVPWQCPESWHWEFLIHPISTLFLDP
eukprot:1934505-Rhodomonas_salina.1